MRRNPQDDSIRALQRAASQGDEGARTRLAIELLRRGERMEFVTRHDGAEGGRGNVYHSYITEARLRGLVLATARWGFWPNGWPSEQTSISEISARSGLEKIFDWTDLFMIQVGKTYPGATQFPFNKPIETLEGHRSNPFELIPSVLSGMVGGAAFYGVGKPLLERVTGRKANPRLGHSTRETHEPYFMVFGEPRNTTACGLPLEGPGAARLRVRASVTCMECRRLAEETRKKRRSNPQDDEIRRLERVAGRDMVGGGKQAAIQTILHRHQAGHARRSNPLGATLMVVGNPSNDHDALQNDPRHKGPAMKLPHHMVKGTITIAEALRRNIPGIREAIAGFPRFHKAKPSDKIVIIDDGRKDNVAGFLIGRAPEVVYDDVPTGSNKQGSVWVHRTRKNKPTYLVHIPVTNSSMLVGGMKVTDWLRG